MTRKSLKRVKWVYLLLILGLAMSVLVACGQTASTPPPAPSDAGEGQEAEGQITGREVTLGIIQIVAHPSLDAAREGFLDVLQANGYVEGENLKVVHKDAQGDMTIAQSIAQQFAQDEPDLILAIATPTAQAMANATKEIPILITAVTDPVEAKLVASMEKPGGNVTGTSDYVSIADQLGLLQEIVSGANNIGLIYNSGEENSIVQAEEAKAYAQEKGLNIVEATPVNSSEVLQAAQSLIGKVDAIFVPTDNTVVSALEAIVKVSYENKIPMFPGEGDSVARGGVATAGVNYYQLGRQTGEQALRILDGVDPGEIPVEIQTDISVIVNLKAAQAVDVEISEEILARAAEIIEE